MPLASVGRQKMNQNKRQIPAKSSFVCPCVERSPLRLSENKLLCQRAACPHSNAACGFRFVDEVPIIISDRVCDTVCDPEKVTTYVRRSSSWISSTLRWLTGTSRTTKANVDKFRGLLKINNGTAKILVIGAGERGSGTEALWSDSLVQIEGVDIYLAETVDVVCDAHYLPYSDETFDGVWIQAVLEHVVEPQVVVAEIHRVLKKSGLVYAETPFMQQVHEGAYDFTRFTVLGHRYLFRDFELIEAGGNKGAETVLAWSFRYFIWALTRSRSIARLFGIGMHVLLRPFALLLTQKSLFDASSGVYFLGRKSKNRISHSEILKLYNGLG